MYAYSKNLVYGWLTMPG